MDTTLDSPPLKKRRIPKACAACRKSKSAMTCTWHEKTRDPVDERLERVEQAVWALNRRLDDQSTSSPQSTSSLGPSADRTGAAHDSLTSKDAVDRALDRPTAGSAGSALSAMSPLNKGSFSVRKPACRDVVSSGLLADLDARAWFDFFFNGCNRFVPIFDPNHDTYSSVRERSSILFDVLVTFGCRAAAGSLSNDYQRLHHIVRQHVSDLTLHDSEARLEGVQALLVIASYSESGAIICDIALRESLKLHLPEKVTALFSSLGVSSDANHAAELHDLIPVRVYYGLVLLDQILSLDGGKPASISLHSTSRRVRVLVAQPRRTPLDLRLFAQVELNELRASSYAAVIAGANSGEQSLQEAIDGGVLDLSMWQSEWQALIYENLTAEDESAVFTVNLRIQHAWAILTLQLRALTASGVANIALMTESQRTIASAAKVAAERHLELLLTGAPDVPGSRASHNDSTCEKPYVARFRYAMEFVLAKNAFCVLIVLRLAILLGDPLPAILNRLQQARDFLDELSKVGMGANVSYTRILVQTIKKCHRAVEASMQAPGASQLSHDSDDGDFQSFVPHEFLFEWDFPGLNLCYIPLDWQDLFLDFGSTD